MSARMAALAGPVLDLSLPAGWRLTGASAVITGTAGTFDLAHTRAACSFASPSPRTSTAGSASPTPGTHESGSPSPRTSASGTPNPGGSESPSTPGLPITGASLTSPIISGLVLVAGGALPTTPFQRRRDRFGAEN